MNKLSFAEFKKTLPKKNAQDVDKAYMIYVLDNEKNDYIKEPWLVNESERNMGMSVSEFWDAYRPFIIDGDKIKIENFAKGDKEFLDSYISLHRQEIIDLIKSLSRQEYIDLMIKGL